MHEELLKITILNACCILILLLGYQWWQGTFNILLFFLGIIYTLLFHVVIRYGVKKYIYRKVVSAYRKMYDNQTVKVNIPNAFDVENLSQQMMEYAKIKNREIDELKVRENYRKEFIGNVSHELKTPLSSIQGFVHTLLDGAMNSKEVLKDYLIRTDKNIDRLMTIVEELDMISKYEHGKIKLKKRKFDIVFLIKEVFDLLYNKAKKNGVNLYMHKKYEGCMVYADREKIEQVLINLIDNSIKYACKDQAETVVLLEIKSNTVVIHIKDNGEGILKRELSKIFERFYRVDKSRSRQKGGSGLGLAIVKHIIDAHGQNVFVKSELHKGSVFSFSICRKEE